MLEIETREVELYINDEPCIVEIHTTNIAYGNSVDNLVFVTKDNKIGDDNAYLV